MLIKPNDRGYVVAWLQTKLGINSDGHYGPLTGAAVRTYQTTKGLTPDGLVGPSTLAQLGYTPEVVTGHKLTTQDFIRTGQELACHPAMVQAIALKETRGEAFLSDGRPKILFERHQFYKRLPVVRKPGQTVAELLVQRDQLVKNQPNICNPQAGGYQGGAVEYKRLAAARIYSDTAALESTSWGQFQVMGFNAVGIGYDSVQEFVRLMNQGVDQHLEALSRFIKANRQALEAIRARDYRSLALAYNGPRAPQSYNADLAKYFEQSKNQYA